MVVYLVFSPIGVSSDFGVYVLVEKVYAHIYPINGVVNGAVIHSSPIIFLISRVITFSVFIFYCFRRSCEQISENRVTKDLIVKVDGVMVGKVREPFF